MGPANRDIQNWHLPLVHEAILVFILLQIHLMMYCNMALMTSSLRTSSCVLQIGRRRFGTYSSQSASVI